MTAPTAAPAAAPAEAPERVWVAISHDGLIWDASVAEGLMRAQQTLAPGQVATVAAYVPESALAAERERSRRLREAVNSLCERVDKIFLKDRRGHMSIDVENLEGMLQDVQAIRADGGEHV